MNTLVIALLGLLIPFNGTSRETDRPPNIILVMADDLGVAELGCTGSEMIRTPNIDALRAKGMLFTNAYSGSTVCAPSRCTLLTGLHTGHSQVRDNYENKNHSGLPGAAGTERIDAWTTPPAPDGRWGGQLALAKNTETLARMLRREGYATCGVGKWGLGGPGSQGHPNAQGFDHWFGYLCQRNAHNYYPTHLDRNGQRVGLEGNDRGLTGDEYATDLMADEAVAFVRENAAQPFFLYYATPVPHLALQVPDDSLAEYQGLWDDPAYEGGQGYLPHPEPRAAYAAMVTRFDRDMGRLFETIEELGITDETIILVTSDNGSTFDLGGYDPEFFDGTGGLRGAKTWLHEGGVRVPLVVTWPGRIEPGSTSELSVANWDFFPTLLSIAGGTTSTKLDGIDFSPVLLNEGPAPSREGLYWEYHSRGGMQAARLGDWKGLRVDAHGAPQAPIQLFDLKHDPNETTDLAADHPEIVRRIDAFMADSRSTSKISRWNFDPNERAAVKSEPSTRRLWTGGGGNLNFSNPENWTGAGAIDLSRLRDVFVIDDPTLILGGTSGVPRITLAGGALELDAGTLSGVQSGLSGGSVTVRGGALHRQFLSGSHVTLSGLGVLRLRGGAEPINRSTVAILGSEARIEFLAQTTEEVVRKHLRKITVDGEPARDGVNVILTPDGAGCVLSVHTVGAS
jgi:arylsulfatase A